MLSDSRSRPVNSQSYPRRFRLLVPAGIDLKLLHLPVDVGMLDPHGAGGRDHAPPLALQGAYDELPFELVQHQQPFNRDAVSEIRSEISPICHLSRNIPDTNIILKIRIEVMVTKATCYAVDERSSQAHFIE